MNDEYEVLKIENQLCFPLYVCAKEIVKKYKPFLDGLDLTYTQYITMMVLWEHNKLSVKELGEYLYLDSGTLTPLLKTLEKKGLVTRYRSTEDERVLFAEITEKAIRLRDQAVDVPSKISNCIHLNKEDAIELYRILHVLLKEM